MRSKRLSMAYQLKEDFRSIYESNTTVAEGKERFEKWLTKTRSMYGKIL
jgi:transposase